MIDAYKDAIQWNDKIENISICNSPEHSWLDRRPGQTDRIVKQLLSRTIAPTPNQANSDDEKQCIQSSPNRNGSMMSATRWNWERFTDRDKESLEHSHRRSQRSGGRDYKQLVFTSRKFRGRKRLTTSTWWIKCWKLVELEWDRLHITSSDVRGYPGTFNSCACNAITI